MRIVYLASACDHTSGPLCDELYRVYGNDFVFIETAELDESRRGIGSAEKKAYTVSAAGRFEEMKALCTKADILIFGFAPIEYIEERIKRNLLTVYYSERLFKNGYYRYFNPITMAHVRQRFVVPSKNSNFHLLCASSFAAFDFDRVGAFRGKMYKWGYQTAVYQKNIDALMAVKPADGLQFIWVGRLVSLKHCGDALSVVARLRENGYDARMTVIGSGEEEDGLKALTSSLGISGSVNFAGTCPITETRSAMDGANIFMFTSDFGEGWGVTLNECMNSGCACVASHAAGATNFLVNDKKDGLVYRSGDVEMLYERVRVLAEDRGLRESIGRAAYEKMFTLWNPVQSSKRMIRFIEEIKERGTCDLFEEGPCSKSLPIKHDWYKG